MLWTLLSSEQLQGEKNLKWSFSHELTHKSNLSVINCGLQMMTKYLFKQNFTKMDHMYESIIKFTPHEFNVYRLDYIL